MSRVQRIEKVAQAYVDASTFSGIEWRVESNGELLSTGAVGHADAAAKNSIPEGAIYRIFSMTKPIISLLALQLVELGRLRLYDMVAQYDSRFAQMMVLTSDGAIVPAQRPITIEDLLTHRAGFTYEFIHGCHIAQYYREAQITSDGSCSLDEMMDRLSNLPLAFQPGSQWRYSVSIDVLAHVIEQATGQDLAALLEEHILGPLGMRDTAFGVADDSRARLMPMYGTGLLDGLPPLAVGPQELDPLDVDHLNPFDQSDTFRRGGLGLFSTLQDYSAFARMLISGKSPDGDVLVSRKMLEMLRTNRVPESQMPLAIGPSVFAGYGWGLVGRVQLDSGRSTSLTSVGEFGWAGAATTYFWVDPLEDLFGVIMTQYMGATLPLADDMRSAAYQALE